MSVDKFASEIGRCLGCKAKPCEKACPLGVSPRDFIDYVKNNNYRKAAIAIEKVNPLPQICGLVCPDRFCRKACVRAKIDTALEIPCLQATIMQRSGYGEFIPGAINGKRVAVVGGGPAGLGALFELVKSGYHVDLYEKNSTLGGAMLLIPEYRLPRSVLMLEINRLVYNPMVTLHLKTKITNFRELKQSYDGVILALGEIKSRSLGIAGEKYCISYEKYLSCPEKYKGKKIAISGGGEVALDCAVTAKKNGGDCVEMFVRRRREDMRIKSGDYLELDKFGIKVRELSSITKIIKDKNKYQLCAVKNRINAEGKAEALPGTEYDLAGYDVLVQALGSYYPKEKMPKRFIVAGDMTGTAGTVVQALASGRDAARKLMAGEIK